MKYAELPNNKMLQFPDDTPDEEITARVRRHLGLTQDDLIVAVEKLVKKIDALVKRIDKDAEDAANRQRELVEQIGESFRENVDKLTKSVAAALSEMGNLRTEVIEDFRDAVSDLAASNEHSHTTMRIPSGGYIR
jgi:hypothetical protein